jgi:rhodanese-related sulfurtransferase
MFGGVETALTRRTDICCNHGETALRHVSFYLALVLLLAAFAPAFAEEPVNITRDEPFIEVPTASGTARIERSQDPDNKLEDDWARTSRPCPPFCIQPYSPSEGVTTIGELELIDMLKDPDALVLDSRTPDWFAGGSIPGAINMPYDRITERLDELGCQIDFDGWDCSEAKTVALFCNGPWCGQSPSAIRNMIVAGYPPEKISYYRGGMQVWRLLGLTITQPDS